jgi:hypothetical protein
VLNIPWTFEPYRLTRRAKLRDVAERVKSIPIPEQSRAEWHGLRANLQKIRQTARIDTTQGPARRFRFATGRLEEGLYAIEQSVRADVKQTPVAEGAVKSQFCSMCGTVDSIVAIDQRARTAHIPRCIVQIRTAQNKNFSISVTFLPLSVQHGEIPS